MSYRCPPIIFEISSFLSKLGTFPQKNANGTFIYPVGGTIIYPVIFYKHKSIMDLNVTYDRYNCNNRFQIVILSC